MYPPDGPLAPLLGAESLLRISPPTPISAHAVHRGQTQMKFQLPSSKGTFAEIDDGGVEGINSVY